MRLRLLAGLSLAAVIGSGPTTALAQQDNAAVVAAPDVLDEGVLLYPGGEYGRLTHPLLQPGETYPGTVEKPIQLHMPHRAIAKKRATVTTVATENTASDSAAPQEPVPPSNDTPDSMPSTDFSIPTHTTPAPKVSVPVHRTALAKPAAHIAIKASPPVTPAPRAEIKAPPPGTPAAPQPNSATDVSAEATAIPFSFLPSTAPAAPAAPPSSPPRMAKAAPPAVTRPSPAAVMTTETAAAPSTQGLQKQTQIIFAAGRPDPSPDSVDAIKGLAGPLNSALDAGASRIQIVAYGGQPGDKASDARRLSLQRGRIIRQLLIDGGVPAERIDVRAMGGVTDGQAADRVDVFTKA